MKTIKKIVLTLLVTILISNGNSFAQTGKVLASFKTPSGFCTGLTFDGKYLWTTDRKTDKVYKLDPKTGEVLNTFDSPGYFPTGLTFDGKYLWNSDMRGRSDISENLDGMIFKVDSKTGEVLKTLKSPGKRTRGITWDGKYLWCVDDAKDMIIQLSTDDGSTMNYFPSPSKDPMGITWDGKYLWVSDKIKDEIYMLDPVSGAVIIIANAPGHHIKDLAFDGKNLWCVDIEEDMIYKLAVRDGVKFVKSDEKIQEVILTHQVKVFGPGKLNDMKVHIALPQNRVNQQILEIKYNKQPESISEDRWGQKTALFHYKNIKPVKKFESEVTVKFKSWNVRYFLYPEEIGSLSDIPADAKRYLENSEKYQLDNPIIKKVLKRVVGTEKNPYWIVRKIHQYLIGHLHYIMDGYWDTAPTVINHGHGSCSEYSFTFIALCRAAGIPARYVGSTWNRKDAASFDNVFHRWVEVYLPNFGWVPTDPTHGDRVMPRDQAFPIGLVRNVCLITTESGGNSETMGWTYNFNEFYRTEPKTNLNIEYFADWQPVK